MHRFRLYIAGNSPGSVNTASNLRKIFQREFQDRFTLEVIDIFERPESAIEDDVMVIPTLVKFAPAPTRRVIGDFIEREKVLKGLEIEPS